MRDVENPDNDSSRGPLDELIAMPEAVAMAYAEILGPDVTVTDALRNWIATTLFSLVTLYALSEDRQQIRALHPQDLRGGVLTDGGRSISFIDGRASISGLFLTRAALKRAVKVAPRPSAK